MQLVETLSEDFRPEKYHDAFQENLKALTEAKRKGQTIRAEAKPGRAPVIDMLEALKRSLRNSQSQKPKGSERLRATGTEHRRRRLAS